jgi:hypothetical protein
LSAGGPTGAVFSVFDRHWSGWPRHLGGSGGRRPAAPTSAAYVDVHRLEAALGASTATNNQLGPVKAIGVSTVRSGNDDVTLIRIVVR